MTAQHGSPEVIYDVNLVRVKAEVILEDVSIQEDPQLKVKREGFGVASVKSEVDYVMNTEVAQEAEIDKNKVKDEFLEGKIQTYAVKIEPVDDFVPI